MLVFGSVTRIWLAGETVFRLLNAENGASISGQIKLLSVYMIHCPPWIIDQHISIIAHPPLQSTSHHIGTPALKISRKDSGFEGLSAFMTLKEAEELMCMLSLANPRMHTHY